eukprot:symbB.v1.2.016942.t1/scaffold1306.1/size125945/1
MEAHDDQECWDWAKFNLANTLQLMEARAAEAPSDALQLQAMALNRYMADDGLLYFFCCTSFHNEYCWGPAVPQALIPDVDAWEGVSDITYWYPRCCFPRLRAMLEAPTPLWMERQIERDLRSMSTAEHPGIPWPQKEVWKPGFHRVKPRSNGRFFFSVTDLRVSLECTWTFPPKPSVGFGCSEVFFC